MRVDQIISRTLQLHSDSVAVEQKDEAWSYGRLAEYSSGVSQKLKSEGFSTGDRAVLWMENSAEYIGSYLAVLSSGGVVVPLHQMTTAMEVLRTIRFAGAVTLLTNSPLWKTCGTELEQTPLRSVIQSGERFLLNGVKGKEKAPDNLAQIMFTSGTTGQPKGVMLSHENLISNIESILSYLKLSHHDSIPAVLPFVYAYGNSVMLSHLFVGGRLIVDNHLIYPHILIEMMRKKRVSGFSGVASHYAVLLRHLGFNANTLPTLRYMTSAGGSMPSSYLEKIKSLFPTIDFFVMYGQTEATARLTSLEPSEIIRKQGSAGKPIPNVSLRILKEDGTKAQPGEAGQIIASGANVMNGYWKDIETTGKVLRDGWLYTGDLGYLDEEGYLYITGRSSEMIKTGGFRVDPAEIEEVLLRHPAVEEVGTVGKEDQVMGEVVICFVVCKSGIETSKNELLAHCARNLANYKCPREIRFLKELPRSFNGKLLRRMLKEMVNRPSEDIAFRRSS